MQKGDLTFEDVRKAMPYLDMHEFTLKREYGVSGFSRDELISLNGWKIIGIAETGGDTLYAFVCMFERLSDEARCWCQVSFREVEKHIKTCL